MPAPLMRVYLDTSFFSVHQDERDPVRRHLTRLAWVRLQRHEPLVSEVVINELGKTPDTGKRARLLGMARPLPLLPATGEAASLARAYVEAGIFTHGMMNDAVHVSTAVTSGVPLLLSWNFKHLVNRARRTRVNLVNVSVGWEQIEILSPPELP